MGWEGKVHHIKRYFFKKLISSQNNSFDLEFAQTENDQKITLLLKYIKIKDYLNPKRLERLAFVESTERKKN